MGSCLVLRGCVGCTGHREAGAAAAALVHGPLHLQLHTHHFRIEHGSTQLWVAEHLSNHGVLTDHGAVLHHLDDGGVVHGLVHLLEEVGIVHHLEKLIGVGSGHLEWVSWQCDWWRRTTYPSVGTEGVHRGQAVETSIARTGQAGEGVVACAGGDVGGDLGSGGRAAARRAACTGGVLAGVARSALDQVDGVTVLNLRAGECVVVLEHAARVDQTLALRRQVGVLGRRELRLEVGDGGGGGQGQDVLLVVGGLHVKGDLRILVLSGCVVGHVVQRLRWLSSVGSECGGAAQRAWPVWKSTNNLIDRGNLDGRGGYEQVWRVSMAVGGLPVCV